MSDSLFAQLKKMGIDEEMASQVSASLDPDHNASKKDVLIMQEAILQAQAKADERYYELKMESNKIYTELKMENNKIYTELKLNIKEVHSELKSDNAELKLDIKEVHSELKADIVSARSELSTEIHTTINRQYLVTFGSALLTIATVLGVNWYYHMT